MSIVCSNLELRLTSAIIASLALLVAYQAAPVTYLTHLICVLFIWIFIAEWPRFFSPTSWQYYLYGTLYLAPAACSLSALNQSETARFLLPLMCLIAFSADGGAYIFGKLWGTKKLCPTISPHKTWVGLAGGYITASAVVVAYYAYTHQTIPAWQQLLLVSILGCITSTLAVAGDLFESYLKRKAGLKDSGLFLPGHGGALDRIDSLIPVSIFFYAAQNWILAILN